MTTNEQNTVEVYKGKIAEIVEKSETLTIATQEENNAAIERKAKINKLAKEIKAEKEKATKPLNEALRKVREWWAPLEAAVEAEEKKIGKALLAYKDKVAEETKIEEARIAARVEKGTMKVETAERKIGELEEVKKTTHTEHGQVQFRKVPMMRIVNESLIPDKYWVIDSVSLRRDVIAGVEVPGAEKYYEERV